MDSNYVTQRLLKSLGEINASIKRGNKHLKDLREQKKKYEKELYDWMVQKGYEEYGGIKLKKIEPKKIKRKKKSEKKAGAIMLFEKLGINDPETLWNELEKTQKYQENLEDDDNTEIPF